MDGAFQVQHRNAAGCVTWSQSPGIGGGGTISLSDEPDAVAKKVATFVPKSPKEMGRLQRRLTRAGYPGARAAAIYALAEMVLPVIFGLGTIGISG